MSYIDTSVLAAYYCPEADSDKAEKAVLSTQRPAISTLTEVEMASAVSRKIREGNLSQEDGKRILDRFHSDIRQKFYQRLQLTEKHYKTAQGFISRFSTSLRTLDALHLALACNHNLTVVTSDKKLAESAEKLDINILKI